MSRRVGQIVALLSVLSLIAVVIAYQFFDERNRLRGDVLDAGYEGAQVCGNSMIESGEQCDDGNTLTGDGCSDTCQTEVVTTTAICGNGTVEEGEQCDDANALSGDGCSSTCQKEEIPVAVCGNSTVEIGEQCDDGNVAVGDGCSELCQTEVVPGVCGNAAVETGEQCDDGNVVTGDGCSELCAKEVTISTEPPVELPPVLTATGEETDPVTGLVVKRFTASYGEQTTLDALLLPQYVPNFRTNVRWTLDASSTSMVQVADPNAATTYFFAPQQEATLKFLLELKQNETYLPIAHYVYTISNPVLLKADANQDGVYNFDDLVNLLQRWESYGDTATQILAVILSRYEQQ